MSAKSCANSKNSNLGWPEMIQSTINRPETDRKCSTYSIILIECSVSCCQSKYSSNSDKHSVVIKKIEKIIITFYVFINLQFLINRFHRGGESAMTRRLISRAESLGRTLKNYQQFDSFIWSGRLRLHLACWVKWSLSGSMEKLQMKVHHCIQATIH